MKQGKGSNRELTSRFWTWVVVWVSVKVTCEQKQEEQLGAVFQVENVASAKALR